MGPLALLPPRRAQSMPRLSECTVNTDLDDDKEDEAIECVMKHTISMQNEKVQNEVKN